MFCKEFTYQTEEKYDNDPGEYGGSKPSRKCTDTPGIILLIIVVATIIAFFGFYIKNSDLDIHINGFDEEGNICGKNNIKIISKSSTKMGHNMEQKKFLIIFFRRIGSEYVNIQKCVESCEMFGATVDNLNRCCMLKQKINDPKLVFLVYWIYMVVMSFLALLMSMTLLILYIYGTSFAVKLSILYFCIALITLSTFYLTNQIEIMDTSTYIPSRYYSAELCLSLSVFIFIGTLVLMRCSNYIKLKLKLSILIFHEAAKSIVAMPLLLILPLITSSAVILCILFLFYGYFLMESYCFFDPIYLDDYKLWLPSYNPVTHGPFYVITICFVWLGELIRAAQYMVVSGCVAQWYYTRNKHHLYKPIKTNILKLLRYHLGTVSAGTSLVAIMQALLQVLSIFKSSVTSKESIFSCICNFMGEMCFNLLTTYLEFFTQNAYIVTAIYGYAFLKASVQAVKILCHNMFNVILINTIGDFILLSAKLALALTIGLIFGLIIYSDVIIEYVSMYIVLVLINSYMVVHMCMSLFEAAIDTIFLCFCEDCKYNNGATKPYYMSTNLVEFVENANKLEQPIKWKINAENWENGPKRLLEV